MAGILAAAKGKSTGLAGDPSFAVTDTGIDTTNAGALFIPLGYYIGSSGDYNTLSFTESINGGGFSSQNTWTIRTHKDGAAVVGCAWAECLTPTALGVAHLVKVTSSINFTFPSLGLIATTSDTAGLSFDKVSAGDTQTATTIATGAATPTNALNFCFAICVPRDEPVGVGPTPTVTAGGFTDVGISVAAEHAVNEGFGVAYKVDATGSQNVTQGTWTSGECAAILIIYTRTATDTLSISENSPSSTRPFIYQRTKGTGSGATGGTYPVPLGGSYTGTDPTTNGWSCHDNHSNSYSLTSVSVNTGAKTWTGIATITARAAADIHIIDVTDQRGITTTVGQSNNFGIGENVNLIGDSSFEHMWTTTADKGTVGSPVSSAYLADGGSHNFIASNFDLATGAAVNGGDATQAYGVAWLANKLASNFGVPVVINCLAIGGTTLNSWRNGNSSWNTMVAKLTNTNLANDAAIWLLAEGANDLFSASSPDYATDLPGLYSEIQTLTGRSTSQVFFGIVMCGSWPDGGLFGNCTDAHTNSVKLDEKTASAATGCFVAAYTHDCLRDMTDASYGAYHWNFAEDKKILLRAANAILNKYGVGGFTVNSAGPSIGSATMSLGSGDLYVNVSQNGGTALKDGTGSTSGSGLLGFRLNIDGTPTPPDTAQITAANVVKLHFNSYTRAGETLTLDYMMNHNPLEWADITAAESFDHALFDNQESYLGTAVGFPVIYSSGISVGIPSVVQRKTLKSLGTRAGKRTPNF